MNLYLIGYRGAGKTTVGQVLAGQLRRPFFDSDEQLQMHLQSTIAELFLVHGESGFRDLEALTVEALCRQRQIVVAWGGGVVLRRDNVRFLKATGKTIWLRGTAELLAQRIDADPHSKTQRPALSGATSTLAEVQQILEQRQSVYAACSDYTVDVDSRSVEELVAKIVCWWRQADK